MGKPQVIETTVTRYDVLQVGLDVFTYDDKFRTIRETVGGYQASECFACGRAFKDGESIGLAITSRGNRAVCQTCGAKLLKELKEAEP